MNGEGLATQNYGVVNFEEYAMSVDSVVHQIVLIQEVQKKVMKSGEHFGTIPGCGDKPTLLKPGAEKLGFTFRLAPEFDVTPTNHPNGHREYHVKCRLRHIPTGTFVGEGVGTCTTMEGKYRFRWDNTGKPVPQQYWETKDKDLLGGPFNATRKIDGKWYVFQRVEHDNPADYYNTCEKMAKKRAHVDAILTATAASDIFTQDIEDMPEVIGNNTTTQQTASQGNGKKPVQQPREKDPTNGDKPAIKDPDAPASDAQVKAISTMWGKLGLIDDMKYAYCSEAAGLEEVIDSTKDLTKGQASMVIDRLNRDIKEAQEA